MSYTVFTPLGKIMINLEPSSAEKQELERMTNKENFTELDYYEVEIYLLRRDFILKDGNSFGKGVVLNAN